jgi:diguanylate cyclase
MPEKRLRIVSSSHISRYKGIYSKVYVTDRASALLLIVKNNLVGILTCAMLASLAIILLIVYAFTRKMIKNTKLLDLALFTMILLLWSFGEVQLAQFFIGNMQLLSTVTFESLIILPVPFLWYIRQDERSGVSSRTEKLFLLPVLDFAICNLLQTAGLASLDATVTVTHITLLDYSDFALVAFEISGIRKSGDGKNGDMDAGGKGTKFSISRAGFIVLMLSAVIDITRYYIARSFSDCGIYTRIGLLVYILSLAIETLTGGFRNILEKQKNELLENILYKDQLTGLGNRAACQRKA